MVKFGAARSLLTAAMSALLGATVLTAAAPAQAQYDDGFRPGRLDRRVVERRLVQPVVERRVIVRRPVERRVIVRRPFARDCRVVVTRRVNRFGERVVVRRRICG